MMYNIFSPKMCLVPELKASWAGNLINEHTPTKIPIESQNGQFVLPIIHNGKKNWCAAVLPLQKNWCEMDIGEYSTLNFSCKISNTKDIKISFVDKDENESPSKIIPKDHFTKEKKISISFTSLNFKKEELNTESKFDFSISLKDFYNQGNDFDPIETRLLKFIFAEKTNLLLYNIYLD